MKSLMMVSVLAGLSVAPLPGVCSGQALTRVALRAGPSACCAGQLGCPQLLGTTGAVAAKRTSRT